MHSYHGVVRSCLGIREIASQPNFVSRILVPVPAVATVGYNVEYMLHSPGGKIPGPPVLAKLEVKAVAAANFHVSQRQTFTR